jgi:predicted ATPase
VVLLSGEAGIGKSRLTAALLERLVGEPHTRLRYFCSPQRTDSAFYPIIGQIGRAARLTHEDTPQARLDKLDALLAQTSTSRQDAALIAEMTPVLRRMQIDLQVALITPLNYIKGWGAPETKAAVEQARLLIEQAEALGEPPEDPLQLFTVLYGFTAANIITFNGDVSRDLAAKLLELAEKQKASFPLVVGHNLLGSCLMLRGGG